MARNSGINADVVNNADGGQIGMGTVQRIFKWLGSNITFTGSGSFVHTFPAATDTVSCLGQDETFTGKKTFNTGTGKTTMNNASGAAPTSPSEGDVWNDSTQKSIVRFVDGIKQYGCGVLYTQTADKTVTNTVTETSVVGTGVGTMTLPANFLVAGKTLRLRIGGIYSTPALGATATIKVKYGSTVLATKATTSLFGGASGLEFDGEVLFTCRTTGSSGTVAIHGDIEYSTGVTGTIAVDPLNNGGATVTLNTTTSNLVDVTVTWDSATITRIATSTVLTFEALN